MPFIDNKKFQEIRGSAKDGNETAMQIMQAMRNGVAQCDIDTLVNNYYGVSDTAQEVHEQVDEYLDPLYEKETVTPLEQVEETETVPTDNIETVDISAILDTEMDGLIDENDIQDTSFSDFIKDKSKAGLRMKKGADYFKAYDLDGRTNYMNKKIDSYKEKFGGRMKDIERRFNDTDKALGMYANTANLLLDDGVDIDMDKTNSAYSDFTGNERAMGSFGRYWDEGDMQEISDALKELASVYGKKNVIAAINVLKSDNSNYRDHLNNQVDEEISRYSKSIEKLLK